MRTRVFNHGSQPALALHLRVLNGGGLDGPEEMTPTVTSTALPPPTAQSPMPIVNDQPRVDGGHPSRSVRDSRSAIPAGRALQRQEDKLDQWRQRAD